MGIARPLPVHLCSPTSAPPRVIVLPRVGNRAALASAVLRSLRPGERAKPLERGLVEHQRVGARAARPQSQHAPRGRVDELEAELVVVFAVGAVVAAVATAR